MARIERISVYRKFTQMGAPSNELGPTNVTVRFEYLLSPQGSVPDGGDGTMKFNWYKPTLPGDTR